MSAPFKFRQFTIIQSVNPHKVGTDSMLLGAWTKTNALRILDIGTGTGILALMMAQNHPSANITAIEPQTDAFDEAVLNFQNSPFRDRILPINTSLQNFSSLEKFDLIICNPPYFENNYLSDNHARNLARHTHDLPVYELYEHVSNLLTDHGKFNLIIPSDNEYQHLRRAHLEKLFPQKIVRTTKPNGTFKRTIIS